jgi:hypothetical protein
MNLDNNADRNSLENSKDENNQFESTVDNNSIAHTRGDDNLSSGDLLRLFKSIGMVGELYKN